jgi:transcriptional regulator with XRE-family HTH domain
MAPTSYTDVLARNIRAARSRADLTQEELAARMRALGFSGWLYQTVGSVERGKRRVTAEEIHGLAWALEVTMPELMSPTDGDREVELPGGQVLNVRSVQLLAGRGSNDMAVMWPSDGGDAPVFTGGAVVRDASGRTVSTDELLADKWRDEAAGRQQEGR